MVDPNELIIQDFKQSQYYPFYLKMLEEKKVNIVRTILKIKNNDVKYTWDDVLKQVLRFIEWTMTEFVNSPLVNPNMSAKEKKEYDKFVEDQSLELLWLKSGIK